MSTWINSKKESNLWYLVLKRKDQYKSSSSDNYNIIYTLQSRRKIRCRNKGLELPKKLKNLDIWSITSSIKYSIVYDYTYVVRWTFRRFSVRYYLRHYPLLTSILSVATYEIINNCATNIYPLSVRSSVQPYLNNIIDQLISVRIWYYIYSNSRL